MGEEREKNIETMKKKHFGVLLAVCQLKTGKIISGHEINHKNRTQSGNIK